MLLQVEIYTEWPGDGVREGLVGGRGFGGRKEVWLAVHQA